MGNLISFFKKVADGLRAEGNFGTAHVYRSTLNIVTTFHGSKYLDFHQVNPEWLKDFEVYLRSRGSSWNTVSTYLRVLRAVYNRAVDLRKAEYIPHLFRSVYTGTRTDRKRALEDEDMRKVFSRLSKSSTIPSDLRRTKELFILMFLLRGLPFVDLAYLRKSDLRGNVITYRRRKTGRSLSCLLYTSDKAVAKVVESIKAQAETVGDNYDKIEQVATVSANNDPVIGKLIADAMRKVSKDGVITIEEAKGTDTTIGVVEGMQFDRGYLLSLIHI